MLVNAARYPFGFKALGLLAGIVALAAASPAATFTTINASPDEPDLVEILDSLYGAGTYQRVDDDTDMVWQAEFVSVVPRATYAGATQQMGYCMVCDGSDDVNLIGEAWGYTTFGVDEFAPMEMFMDPDAQFRLFNSPTNHASVGRTLSDPSMLPDQSRDYMVTFQLLSDPDVYILAFEDWVATTPGSDFDYNDLVVQATFRTSPSLPPPPPPPTETPEPGTLLLFGAGLLGAAWLRGRVRR